LNRSLIGKQKITDQIAQLKYKDPNSPRIVVLEQELVRAEAESLVAEAQLSNITREKIKSAFTYQFDALREHSEKLALIAGYGKHLLELIDDTPVTPGETREAYDGYEASKGYVYMCSLYGTVGYANGLIGSFRIVRMLLPIGSNQKRRLNHVCLYVVPDNVVLTVVELAVEASVSQSLWPTRIDRCVARAYGFLQMNMNVTAPTELWPLIVPMTMTNMKTLRMMKWIADISTVAKGMNMTTNTATTLTGANPPAAVTVRISMAPTAMSAPATVRKNVARPFRIDRRRLEALGRRRRLGIWTR